MTTRVHDLWSTEWAHLDHREITRRINRELCETCAAAPGHPCTTKTGRTHWGYHHATRLASAMETFNREHRPLQ